ncbi:MAG: hypothetical protein M9894_20415 [Planctomycetes bacterium]|nr:hypothetical protein [Planctomycetota bacterium]
MERPRCPVCRARLASDPTCGRCGADLRPVMTLLVEGHRLRSAARRALREGAAARARDLAREAQAVAASPLGARLLAVCALALAAEAPATP